MKDENCKTYWARIYITGPVDDVKRICREYTWNHGLCVTITPTDYIYTGGEESGVIIEIINYPRFPATSTKIAETAINLGMNLVHGLHQRSFSVMTPDETVRFSRGEEVPVRSTK